MSHFNRYSELKKYMDDLGLFHMDLTLDRVQTFWDAKGLPKTPIIHVVGTNGKGSTSAFLCSIARAHGLKVGLFTSPHFLSPRERVQINRVPLSREAWVALANEILETPGGNRLTYFEFQTCLAVLAFEREGVELAIMEAGLGGKFDATNVLRPMITLFTPIGIDHEKILGPTLTAIATDKAGAIHSGAPVITGKQVVEALLPLQKQAKTVGAHFMFAVDMAESVAEFRLGLMGTHQMDNARLALAAWRWYAATCTDKSILQAERFGMESAFLPGRMQPVEIDGKPFLLDGAHNVHALEALKRSLDAENIRPGAIIFTCMADKDVASMVPRIKEITDGPILVPAIKNERACEPQELAEHIGNRAVAVDSMAIALGKCTDVAGSVLICGSLFLLAEVYILYPEFLTP